MASSNFDFTPDGVLQGRIVWNSTSKGSQANASDVTATLYARRTDTYGPTKGQTWSGYVKIVGKDNSNQTNINFSSSVSVGDSWVEMAKVTLSNAKHNDDGSGSVTISGSVTGPSGTKLADKTSSGNKTVTLDKIARYTSITSFSVDKRNETSFTFKWQTADTIDYAWYSTDNGTTWVGYNVADGKSGEFAVSKLSADTEKNLSPNTSYNCKLRVKRKDSQLNTDSGTVKQTTYDYPYCTNSPNFTIGQSVTLTFYNPLNRTFDFTIIGNNVEIYTWTNRTGTSYTGVAGEPARSNLYASIPNSNSGKYKVKVVYGSSVKTRDAGNTYSVGANTSNPTFTDFDYDDVNSTTVALTGNSKILVKGYSNNKITVSSNNFPTAKNSATMKTLRFTQGTKTGEKSAEGVGPAALGVSATLNAIDNNTMVVAAVDSRGNSTSVTKTLNSTYYKSYSPITIKSVTATRGNNGVGQIVTLKVNGTFWNSSFGGTNNDITSATYQYKLSSSGSFSTAKAITLTKSGSNFSFSGTIQGDLGAEGFSAEDSFIIKVTIKDKLSTKSQDVTLGPGTPAIAIYKSKVAIGKKYDTSVGGALQVNGQDFYSVKWDALTNDYFQVNIAKFQREVMIRLYASPSITMASGKYIILGTLPEGWRPIQPLGFPIIIRTSGSFNNLGLLVIRTNGSVEIAQNTGKSITSTQILGTATFFAT